MILSAGSRIGPYEVSHLIGSGGMGEVYRARDTRLQRTVALKVLKQNLLLDSQMKARFLQEARSASALNHPNIITVHDILSEADSDVIVMEYIEGKSLREILSRGPLEIRRALAIAAQVASALAAAHANGIVHRDIKPENIVILPDSRTKVLDFGLAKLVRTENENGLSAEVPTIEQQTRSGIILGTTPYLSPEQVLAQPLDSRTDIFSLGIVLYEMLIGNRPFAGASAVEIMQAILNQQPAIFPPAGDILEKALAKNRQERYQHAGDMELDLKRLQRALESGTVASKIPAPEAKPALSRFVWPALFALALAAFLWLGRSGGRSEPPEVMDLRNATLTPLTVEEGNEQDPSFSPDGETIAYASNRTGNFEIYLRQVSGGADVNITNHPADDINPVFSPDGKQIAFVSTRDSDTELHYPSPDSPLIGGDLWVMPALGGKPRKIVEEGNFPSWSPDGSRLLFCKGPWFLQQLYWIPAIGGEPKEIPTGFQRGTISRLFYPGYSPDGRWIAYEGGGNLIYLLPAEGGKSEKLISGANPVWLDNKTIVYCNTEPGKNFSLWRVTIDSETGKVAGEPQALTLSTGRASKPTISRNGKRIAFGSVTISFKSETMPFDAEAGKALGPPVPLTQGNDIVHFQNYSPDGKSIVFASRRGTTSHIWVVRAGEPPAQLTSDPNFRDNFPRYSPDGNTIAFTRADTRRQPATNNGIWLMSADGGNPRPLGIESSGFSTFFAWTPDGRSIVFRNQTDSRLSVFDLSTSRLRVITDEEVTPVLAVSPDGKWVLYQSSLEHRVDIRRIPFEGGESHAAASTPRSDYHPLCSPSGQWLYFQVDHKNIYRVPGPGQDWRAQEPQQVTNFPESGLYLEDPQFSPDGKQLLYSRGETSGDIWLLEFGTAN